MIEVAGLFIVFLIVNLVLLRMIVKKKHGVTPLTLFDSQGTRYTVTEPGKIRIEPAAAGGTETKE